MVTYQLMKWFLFKYKIHFSGPGCCKMINHFFIKIPGITGALQIKRMFSHSQSKVVTNKNTQVSAGKFSN